MAKSGRVPEWLGAGEAVQRIATRVGGEKEAQDLLAGWIVEGKVPTRARAIERLPSEPDNWGDDDLLNSAAAKLGFAKVSSSGLRFGALELTERFWAEYRDWETDFAHWDWDGGNFVVGYQCGEGTEEPKYWLAKRVSIKARPLMTLFELWLATRSESMTAQPPEEVPPRPTTKRKGRKVDPKRDEWTGQVVRMAIKRQITSTMTPNELIVEVERQLIERGIWGGEIDPLDRTTVYGSAQAVIEAVRSLAPS